MHVPTGPARLKGKIPFLLSHFFPSSLHLPSSSTTSFAVLCRIASASRVNHCCPLSNGPLKGKESCPHPQRPAALNDEICCRPRLRRFDKPSVLIDTVLCQTDTTDTRTGLAFFLLPTARWKCREANKISHRHHRMLTS